MDPVCHFEIPADDPDRAKAFYEAAFSWAVQGVPGMGYHFLFTTAIDEATRMPKQTGAINGGMMARNPLISTPVITIQVEEMGAACARVTAAGGTMLGEPHVVGTAGIAGYFKDSEGNTMGMWQPLGR